ncbi:MAG: hypothetical protein BroJett003_23990 [Planctomycetota bacterium]|nr:MAG: hypothetical protein BroJett003_23990 [Planctomycetota bacterium]
MWITMFAAGFIPGAATAAPRAVRAQESPPKREKPAGDSAKPGDPAALAEVGATVDVPTVRDWRHMSAQERRRFELFVERSFPEVWNELQPQRERDARAYNKRMERLAVELMPIFEEQAENADRAAILIREKQLEMRIQEVVAEFMLAKDEPARAKSRALLIDLVGKLFDAVEERRILDIRRLEERLAVLKQRVAENSRDRDTIIARQVELHLNPTPAPEDAAKTKPGAKPDNSPHEKSP